VDLDVLQDNGICTLRVKGALKYGESLDQFEAAIQSAFDSGHVYLILNLEAMPVIDSTGIGVIVNALQKAKKLNGDTKLVKPSPFAEKTFKMVHIWNLFGVYATEAEAVAACG
jgi:anti-sigma B factor antagonist